MQNRRRVPSVAAVNRNGRWSEAQAKQLLDEWESSGEALAAYARRCAVHPQRLAWWRKRLGGVHRPVARPAAPAFAPVTVGVACAAAERAPIAAAIDFGDSMHVELRTLDDASAQWVATVARALGGAA
jgi:hypothetical protein